MKFIKRPPKQNEINKLNSIIKEITNKKIQNIEEFVISEDEKTIFFLLYKGIKREPYDEYILIKDKNPYMITVDYLPYKHKIYFVKAWFNFDSNALLPSFNDQETFQEYKSVAEVANQAFLIFKGTNYQLFFNALETKSSFWSSKIIREIRHPSFLYPLLSVLFLCIYIYFN